jgi:hypothetical protein
MQSAVLWCGVQYSTSTVQAIVVAGSSALSGT